MHSWLSAHVFVPASVYGCEYDRVLLDVILPFVARCRGQGQIDRFFYIRYNHLGPHLRIRLRGDATTLDEGVRPALENLLLVQWPGLRVEPANSDRTSGDELLHRLRWIPYEPEVERYGGREALVVAEDVFQSSSDAALRALRGLPVDDRGPRLAKAVIAMVIGLQVFITDLGDRQRLARHYHESYLRTLSGGRSTDQAAWSAAMTSSYSRQAAALGPYVAEVQARLHGGEPLSREWDPFVAELLTARQRLQQLAERSAVTAHGKRLTWPDCTWTILPSYIHMMNNRLGVTTQEESYVALLVAETLGNLEECIRG